MESNELPTQLSDQEIRLRVLELVARRNLMPKHLIVAHSIGLVHFVKNGYYPKMSKEETIDAINEEFLLRLYEEVSEKCVNAETSANQPDQTSDNSDNNANPRKSFISRFFRFFRRF